MCLIPSSEGCSIDLNNGRFGEGVGSNEFVVGRVVGDGNDTNFSSDSFGSPGEVTGVETKCAIFLVATSDTDEMDSLVSDTGVGWLTTLLEGSVGLISGCSSW